MSGLCGSRVTAVNAFYIFSVSKTYFIIPGNILPFMRYANDYFVDLSNEKQNPNISEKSMHPACNVVTNTYVEHYKYFTIYHDQRQYLDTS